MNYRQTTGVHTYIHVIKLSLVGVHLYYRTIVHTRAKLFTTNCMICDFLHRTQVI